MTKPQEAGDPIRLLRIAGAFVLATSVLAGCGSTSPSVLAPSAPATPSAPQLPTSTAFATTVVLSPAASALATSMTLALPPSTGFAGEAILPVASVPANLKMTVSYSNRPPTGVTALAALRQAESARRVVLDKLSTDVVYGCFATNLPIDVDGTPSFTFTLPAGFATSSVVYNLAVEQSNVWTTGYGGPGTAVMAGTAATVAITGRFGFAMPANGSVCVALYGRSTNAPTPVPATPAPSVSASPTPSASAHPTTMPTAAASPHPSTSPTPSASSTPTATPSAASSPTASPSASPSSRASSTPTPSASSPPTATPTPHASATPTPTPTATPTPTPTATPTPAPLTISSATLSLLGVGSAFAQSASVVHEPSYTGTFSIAATACAGIATVSPTTGIGPALALTVTGVAAGICTATATDAYGQTASLNITVTVSNLGLDAIERKP